MRSACEANRMSSAPARARTGERSRGRRSHEGSCVPVPDSRRLAAKPDALLRRRSAIGRRRVEVFEHRPAQPRIDEALDVAGRLELSGQRGVGQPPALAYFRILYAGRDADEGDAAQRQILTDRHVQCHARAQRVPEQHAGLIAHDLACGFRHERGRPRQVGPHLARIRVTGQVHGDDRVVLSQQLTEVTPQTSGLGESVQDDEGRPGATHVDMEWHAS